MKQFLKIILYLNIFFGQNIIITDDGMVEIIGLETWSVNMVEDSMKHYADGAGFNQIYCNAVLDKLPFASAVSTTSFKNNKKLVVVSIIEPEYLNQISYFESPHDTLELYDDWKWITEYKDNNSYAFQFALDTKFENDIVSVRNSYDEFATVLSIYGLSFDTSGVSDFKANLSKINKLSDFEIAKHTLLYDANFDNRFQALCVLLNFYQIPQSYYLILNLLREKDPIASVYSGKILKALISTDLPALQFSQYKHSVKSLLQGTNLEHFFLILDFLKSIPNITDEEKIKILNYCKRMLAHFLTSDFYRENAISFLENFVESYGGKNHENWIKFLSEL